MELVSLEQYDEQIALLPSHPTSQLEALELKRKRNALTRIHTIPPEILGKILVELFFAVSIQSLTMYHERPDEGSHFAGGVNLAYRVDWSWTSIMLVSQRFRDIALGCPFLWSITYFSLEKLSLWSQLCLSRVQNYPLLLRVMCHPDHPLSQRSDVQRLFSNCYAIHVVLKRVLDSHANEGEIFSCFDQPYPLLRALIFSGDHMCHYLMSSHFLGSLATNLIRLEIENCNVRIIASPQLPSLQILNLKDVSLASPECLRLLLQQAPYLHSLSTYYIETTWEINQEANLSSWPVLHRLKKYTQSCGDCGVLLPIVNAIIPKYSAHSLDMSFSSDYSEDGQTSDELYSLCQRLMAQYQAGTDGQSVRRCWTLIDRNAYLHNLGDASVITVKCATSDQIPSTLCITMSCTNANILQLLPQMTSLHLEAGVRALHAYRNALAKNRSIRHLRIKIMGPDWDAHLKDLNRIESLLAQRRRSIAFDTMHLHFVGVAHRGPGTAEGVTSGMTTVSKWWQEKGWVKQITFDIK